MKRRHVTLLQKATMYAALKDTYIYTSNYGEGLVMLLSSDWSPGYDWQVDLFSPFKFTHPGPMIAIERSSRGPLSPRQGSWGRF